MHKGMSKTEQAYENLLKKYSVRFSELYTIKTRDDLVYVSDINSYELYYLSNNPMSKTEAAPVDYKGRKCYEVLQGRSEPCIFCTNSNLSRDRDYIWQHSNDLTKKSYILKERLVDWNGKDARMEVAMDITGTQRMSQVLRDILEGQNLLFECNQMIKETDDLQSIIENVLKRVAEYFDTDCAFCVLYNDEHSGAIYAREGFDYAGPMFCRYPSKEAIEAWEKILRVSPQIMIDDIETAEMDSELRKKWIDYGINSFMTAPIFCNDKLLGLFDLNNIKAHENQIYIVDMISMYLGNAVSEKMLYEENFRLQYKDTLTGTYNFEGFKLKVAEMLLEYPEKKYVLCNCDIKDFKYINEAFGFDVGDRLLKYWIDFLEGNRRKGDICCRVTGDTVCCLRWYDNETEIQEFFNRVRDKINAYPELAEKNFSVELAGGVYYVQPSDNLKNINVMLDRAAMAKNSAKRRPGSNLGVFSTNLYNQTVREIYIAKHTLSAIENGEIFVCYQPQYDFANKRIIGAEALARWSNSELGNISPAEFVPVLEKNGQAFDLDMFVCEESCKFLKNIQNAEIFSVPVSINISRTDLHNPALCSTVEKIVKKYGLKPSDLNIEITESAYVDNPDELNRCIENFKQSGFKVEMDDFGSGYSSLNTLKNVPVDMLKLDMSFLMGEQNTERGGNILSSVVRMAHWLDLAVIAEGVETKEQAQYLNSIGCKYMQGYYFAKPLSQDEFRNLLENAEKLVIEKPKYRQVSLKNLDEFLDSSGKTSFLFNKCMGGAMLFESTPGRVEPLLVNENFYSEIGENKNSYSPWRRNFIDSLEKPFNKVLLHAIKSALIHGEANCEVKLLSHGKCSKENWLNLSMRPLSSNSESHIFFCSVQNIGNLMKEREANMCSILASSFVLFYDKVYDLNMERDSFTLVESKVPMSEIGIKKTGLREKIEKLVSSKSFDEHNSAAISHFLDLDRIRTAYQNNESEEIVVCGLKNGRTFWNKYMIFSVRENRCLLCVSDITEIVESEAQKREQDKLKIIESLISNMPVGFGIFEISHKDINIKFINDYACSALGYKKERVMFYSDDIWKLGVKMPPLDMNNLEKLALSEEIGEKFFYVEKGGEDVSCYRAVISVRRGKDTYICYAALIDVTRENELRANWGWKNEQLGIIMDIPKMMLFDYRVNDDIMNLQVNHPKKGQLSKTYSNFRKYLKERANIEEGSRKLIAENLDMACGKPVFGNLDFRADNLGLGYRWNKAVYKSLADETGEVVRIVGRIDDIEDKVLLHNDKLGLMQKPVKFDSATGLRNRTSTKDGIDELLDEGKGGVFFVLEIEEFDDIINHHGHMGASLCLKKTAECIQSLFRESDILGRTDESEFVAFIPRIDSRDFAVDKGRNIISRITDICVDGIGHINCCMGVVVAGKNDRDFNILSRKANIALYEARQAGKGKVVMYQGSLGKGTNLEIVNDYEHFWDRSTVQKSSTALINSLFSQMMADKECKGLDLIIEKITGWMNGSRGYVLKVNEEGEDKIEIIGKWNAFEESQKRNSCERQEDRTASDVSTGIEEEWKHYFNQSKTFAYVVAKLTDNGTDDMLLCDDMELLCCGEDEKIFRPYGTKAIMLKAVKEDGKIKMILGIEKCLDSSPWSNTQIYTVNVISDMIWTYLKEFDLMG